LSLIIMDKVSILTASRVEPQILPYSTEVIITSLSPILQSALDLQRILSSISLHILLQAYTAACFTLTTAVWSSRIVAVHTFFVVKGGVWVSQHAFWWTWTSKGVVAAREHTFKNFATWVLGSGNGIILVLFWPGWWCIAGTSCAIWVCCG
jgi:hypothetical protein